MARRRRSFTFFVVFASVVAITHFYLLLKLVWLPELPAVLAAVAEAVIAAGGLLLVVHPLLEHRLERRHARLFSWPARLWMGFAFLLLVGFLSSDIVLGAADAVRGLTGWAPLAKSAGLHAGIVFFFVAAAAAFALVAGLRHPPIRRVSISLDRWPESLDGFRIVQLSDLHIGTLLGRRFAAELTRRVGALDPDLVALTGDLVDGSVDRLAGEVEPLRDLRARHGVWFVTGNHEYFSRADPWIEKFREFGFRALRNERVPVEPGGVGFDLAGVDDRVARFFGGDHGEDLPRALAGRDATRALVLLAHNPAIFAQAALAGVDLQLSGHTHGGQIWPFRWLVRLSGPWIAGVYEVNGSRLYVSRGTGFWGPPLRLGAPAEITEIVLRSAPA